MAQSSLVDVQRLQQRLVIGEFGFAPVFGQDRLQAVLLHPPVGGDIEEVVDIALALIGSHGLVALVLDLLHGRHEIFDGPRRVVLKIQTAILDDLLVIQEETHLVVGKWISNDRIAFLEIQGHGVPAVYVVEVILGNVLA